MFKEKTIDYIFLTIFYFNNNYKRLAYFIANF